MDYKGYSIVWRHNEIGNSYVSVYLDGEWKFNEDGIDEACKEIDRMEVNECQS